MRAPLKNLQTVDFCAGEEKPVLSESRRFQLPFVVGFWNGAVALPRQVELERRRSSGSRPLRAHRTGAVGRRLGDFPSLSLRFWLDGDFRGVEESK